MKTPSRSAVAVVVLWIIGSVITIATAAQPTATSTPSRADIVTAARSVIQQARYATLTTTDAEGQPQSRVVDPFTPDADFTIWIGTNARTRKVSQIAARPRVSLLYFDASRQSYVSFIGTASVVRDAAAKAKWWKDEWSAFYINKNLGDDYVLIRLTPTRLEIVSDVLGMKTDPVTWRPVTLDLQ
jgi:general stress protein 26